MDFKLNIENSIKSILGEGPLWDDVNNLLYYVDIEGKNIRQYNVETKSEKILVLPQKVGSIFFSRDMKLLAALEDGVYRVDTMELIHKRIKIKGERFNDGKVGPDGNIYVGTISKDSNGALYKITPEGDIFEILSDVSCSNGIDWSIDEKTMYYIDTPTSKVEAFDFNGDIKNRRTIYELGKDEGIPDGMCIDMDGILHVALWMGSGFISIDPIKGEILDKTYTGAYQTTCIEFGGSDLKTMFITSANMCSDDTKPSSTSGRLLSLRHNVEGRQCYKFDRQFNDNKVR